MTHTVAYSEAISVFLGFYQKKDILFRIEIKQGKDKEKAIKAKSTKGPKKGIIMSLKSWQVILHSLERDS